MRASPFKRHEALLSQAWRTLQDSILLKAFCPECNQLGYPEESGMMRCMSPGCGFTGWPETKTTTGDPMAASQAVLDTSKVQSQEPTYGPKGDEDPEEWATQHYRGADPNSKAGAGPIMASVPCPNCEENVNEDGEYQAHTNTKQTRSADEAETKFLTCTHCNHKWREYQ